ncbi:dihydrodipicolinate synthase family protein [Halorubrum trueperi]|uniref:Dihydrodipicolinate synthase family protein n=1 Tax=Halorubrum trueperi TaxID=2004704 RepID=A0ABD5UN86_9EURY
MSSIKGVIPASLVPFNSDQSINESGYQDHISHLASHAEINGILSNGHAGESYALSSAERARIVELAIDAAPDTSIYSGVVGATTREVIEDAQNLEKAGVDAVMVDAPYTPINKRPQAAIQFYEKVTESVDVPVVLFQVAASSGRDYPPELLADLAEIEGIVAIKEGVWDVDRTQEDVLALREREIEIDYLMGNDEQLLPCYAFGVDGTVVELAATIPKKIIALYNAVKEGEMHKAQAIHRQLAPFLEAVYQDPKHDSSIRLKVALELTDRLPTAIPREPALPIPEEEREEIRVAMRRSDLL